MNTARSLPTCRAFGTFTALWRWLVEQHLWIGLCAVALVYATHRFALHIQEPLWSAEYLIAFTGAFIAYRSQELHTLWSEMSSPLHRSVRFVQPWTLISRYPSCMALIVLTWAVFQMGIQRATLYLPAGIITVLYLFPLHPSIFVRRLPFAKIFLISACWTWITATTPLALHGTPLLEAVVHPISWERFAFIFALTVPFDIRDMEEDARAGLKTLPNILGSKVTKITGIFAVCLWVGLHYVAMGDTHYTDGTFLATVLAAIPTIGLILWSHPLQSELYFTGYVDGMMLVWVVLMEALHNILA